MTNRSSRAPRTARTLAFITVLGLSSSCRGPEEPSLTRSRADETPSSSPYDVVAVRVAGAHGQTVHVEVRDAADGSLIRTIDPNEGGIVSPTAYTLDRVAGDNVLISWSCGSFCSESSLFAIDGTLLGNFGAHLVSPDRAWAVSHPATRSFSGSEVLIVDLSTGKTLTRVVSDDAWNTCGATWAVGEVTLVPCSDETRPLTVHFDAQ